MHQFLSLIITNILSAHMPFPEPLHVPTALDKPFVCMPLTRDICGFKHAYEYTYTYLNK